MKLTDSARSTNPLFSVLIPTHNRCDVVGLAIESVLRQTLEDFELIVLGDGCTDDTAAVVGRFDDPRLLWLNEPKAPNLGYANRNVALARARGHYVAYCAHDDLWFEDHLERMFNAFDGVGKEWVYSQPIWISSDGVLAPIPGDLRSADMLDDFQRENYLPACSIAHSRDLLDRVDGWPAEIASGGDWVLWKRMIENIGVDKVGYDRTPTSMHFTADWKTTRHSDLPALETALQVADAVRWWPPVLKLEPESSDTTLQAAAAKRLRNSNEDFVSQVREGCCFVLERFATDLLRYLLPVTLSARDWKSTDATAIEIWSDRPHLIRRLSQELLIRDAALERQSRALAAVRLALNLKDAELTQNEADNIARVRQSRLFDADWYLATNLDVAEAGVDPAYHFYHQGWREGRRPSAQFDIGLYLQEHPDLWESGVNPLIHCLQATD